MFWLITASPYYAPESSGWQTRYRLKQDSPAVDAGSCLAIERWPHPNNRYTTRVDGVCDLGIADIGFHYYSFVDADSDGMDDAWETYWFGGPGQSPGGDFDGDGLTNLTEYQSGLKPSSTDTDGDGKNDLADSQPLCPNFDKGPYLQNTGYVSGQGSAITVMCETPVNNVLKVRYRKPPASWASKAQTARVSPESGHQVHEIEITGLDPDSTYDYEVGYGFCFARGDPTWTLLTAPSAPIPFRFVAYGDNRGDAGQPWGLYELQENHQAVVNAILTYSNPAENPIRFVVHSGDLVHNGGEYVQWKPQFFEPAWDLHKKIAIFEALGNHEYYIAPGDYDIDPEAIKKYLAFFDLPEGQNGAAPTERWYTFAYSNCRFICLDTNIDADYANPSNQRNWLIGVLDAAEQEESIDWVFVFFHDPAYCYGGHAPKQTIQRDIVPVLESHDKVIAAFSRHNHYYQRCLKSDIDYIVTGGGGAPLADPAGSGQYWQEDEKANHWCEVDVDPSAGTVTLKARRLTQGGIIETYQLYPTP